MQDNVSKPDHEPKQTLVETLENELKLDKHRVEKDIIKVIECNICTDIDNEIKTMLKDIKSNMSFGLYLRIVLTLIIVIGVIFLLFNWIFFG